MRASLKIRDGGKVVCTLGVAPVGKNNYTVTVDGVEHSRHEQFGYAWRSVMWISQLNPADLEDLVLAPLRRAQA